ncbi:MAG: pyruvate kinase alpha/beta domain-containing protein, partial [Terriglobia bacterium]
AVMLSGETATGRYPREAVAMMGRIICEAETVATQPLRPRQEPGMSIAETVAETAAAAADQLRLKAIVVFTESGSSARLVSKARPTTPVIAFSPHREVRRRMALYWGTRPRRIPRVREIDALAREAEKRLRREKLARRGDVVALVAGTPLQTRGTTNLLKFHTIGARTR